VNGWWVSGSFDVTCSAKLKLEFNDCVIFQIKHSVTGKTIKEVIMKLEQDANNVLKFMASNGLVANLTKTTLMILNFKGKEKVIIKIGEALISQVDNAKLLGVKIEENQDCKKQIQCPGGVVSALNQRLFLLKRMKTT
jgi:hypothetical protein